ncbi:MAG: NADPH-dependent FMN reductase, partial [Bacteroidota bacterium]
HMITLISSTNRPGSLTRKIALVYQAILTSKSVSPAFLDLAELPSAFLNAQMYDKPKPDFTLGLQDTHFIPARKFIFILPEYNGSFPGVLKLLIDGLESRRCFEGKKAALLGVSTGRAGNLRGMDHFSGVLHYMGVSVMPKLAAVSHADTHLSPEGVADEKLTTLIQNHCQQFLEY